jgi:hypothetical protein
VSSEFLLSIHCPSNRVPRIVCVLAIFALAGHSAAARAADQADPFWRQRDTRDAAYATQLKQLADRCEELNLQAQARVTRGWYVPRDPRRQYVFLPAESDPVQPAADAPTVVHQWYGKFREYRAQQAEVLFNLARQQLAADQAARAFRLLHEVLHENPDHEVVRDALGYRRINGRWRRPESVIRPRAVSTADRRFGFPAGNHWVVESGSFRVTTDHSPAAGQQLIERLEELHDVWQQLFFDYYSTAATLARRLENGSPASRGTRQHEVVLFRDRQQYVDRLRRIEPRIEITVGYYLEPQKTAFFYVADQPQNDIYLHEVTHQLFSETGRVAPGTGLQGNFWIIEGIAMYMESLCQRDRYYTLGGVDADRLQYARYRALREGVQMPLAELVALGREELQQHADIRRLYSQSAGLTAMLMDGQRGRYRTALVDYLAAVYQGRDRVDTLASLTGVSLDQLDAQYMDFLNVTDADLAALADAPPVENLSLGRTSVTDAGLKCLPDQPRLRWLDIGYTQVGDAGLACLASARQLNHLIAEHSQLTDAGLQTIGSFRELQILDLAGVPVTDQGLSHLASLTSLTELWLGDTQITDAGLVHLQDLKQLQTLDVGGTQVTIEGWNRLKAALPALNTEANGAP